MRVFRIVLAPYSDKLYASGRPARWNSKGTFVIYTASSRALACLENVVHRSGRGLSELFRTMVIEIPEELKIKNLGRSYLPEEWNAYQNQIETRARGDEWVRSMETAVLRVPSAIIPEEHNYLINTAHPDFSKIELVDSEAFMFDDRL